MVTKLPKVSLQTVWIGNNEQSVGQIRIHFSKPMAEILSSTHRAPWTRARMWTIQGHAAFANAQGRGGWLLVLHMQELGKRDGWIFHVCHCWLPPGVAVRKHSLVYVLPQLSTALSIFSSNRVRQFASIALNNSATQMPGCHLVP